ncbi:hypothetical protein ANO11243_080230 [Dothideomycetidae sp. 11243]|nr:hypothetical protein ANO11243_080230 [fungal sp. No.11243]
MFHFVFAFSFWSSLPSLCLYDLNMKSGHKILLKCLPVFLLLVLFLAKAREQNLYERFLQSSIITFKDFAPAYEAALIEAQKEGKQPEYHFPPAIKPGPADQRVIPPIIHFIWFQNLYHDHLDVSQIPAKGSHAPGRCRDFNPEFEVIIWNATGARTLLEERYAWFLPTYDAYKYPIQRVDAFKYFVLWHYGGIYMDLDVSCRRALNPLLPFPAWFPKAQPFGVNNDLMASRARHPLLGMMLEQLEVRNRNLLFPYLTIFWSTGPQFTSDVLKMWYQKLGGMDAAGEDTYWDKVYILPQDFYSEKYTFFGHSPGGTWHGKDVAFILWLVDHPWVFVVLPVLISPVFVVWIRRRRILQARYRGYRHVDSQ